MLRAITRLNVGGPSYQAIYLTQRLQGPEFESSLLIGSTSPNEGNMEGLADERKVAYTRIPGLGREISLRADLGTFQHLFRAMRQHRPHLVHTHLAKAGTIGRLAAKAARVPALVHTYHGHVFHGYFSKRKTELFIRIERALARWTDRIIVLGERQKREILGFGVGREEQMRQIPLGLELQPFLRAESRRGELREELGIPADTPLIGIVARLVPIKAHDLFLEAAARVARSVPRAQFLIVGDGDLRADLEERAVELGLPVLSYGSGKSPTLKGAAASSGSGCVHFLGFRSDLLRLYADLDVVTLCSRNEGLPVTLIEALAAARPVVAADVGEVQELVSPGESGLLVPAGSPERLAEGIVAQLEDRHAAGRMALRGRERVHPRFSIERLESDIRALYRELADGMRGGSQAAA